MNTPETAQAFRKELGTRLRQARKSSGRTLKEIERELGFSQSAINGWELARFSPGVVNLTRLCTFYGCSADTVLGLDKKS